MLHNGHIHKYCWYMCNNAHFQEGLCLQIFLLWRFTMHCLYYTEIPLSEQWRWGLISRASWLRDLTEQELCSGGGACLSSGKLSLSSEPSEEVLGKKHNKCLHVCSTYLDLQLFCLSYANIFMYQFHTLPGIHEIKLPVEFPIQSW